MNSELMDLKRRFSMLEIAKKELNENLDNERIKYRNELLKF